jgi:hypothetical protein
MCKVVPTTEETLTARLLQSTIQALELNGIYLGKELGLYAALKSGSQLTPPELAQAAGILGAETRPRSHLAPRGSLSVREFANGPAPCQRGSDPMCLEETMRTFDVQSIELDVAPADAFGYLVSPATLPEWTHAFKTADARHATMSTPQGTVQVNLRVDASEQHGTIDWTMTFPNGVVARAHSRVTPHRGKSIYTFVLEAPSAPLEELEGALDEQSRVLADELSKLAARVGARVRGHSHE